MAPIYEMTVRYDGKIDAQSDADIVAIVGAEKSGACWAPGPYQRSFREVFFRLSDIADIEATAEQLRECGYEVVVPAPAEQEG